MAALANIDAQAEKAEQKNKENVWKTNPLLRTLHLAMMHEEQKRGLKHSSANIGKGRPITIKKTIYSGTGRNGVYYTLNDKTGYRGEVGQSFNSDGSWLGNFLGDKHSVEMPLVEGGSSWHTHGDESGPSMADINAMDASGSKSMKVVTPSNKVYNITEQQPDRWDLLVQQLSTITGNNSNTSESYIRTLEESVQRIEYLLQTQLQGLNTLIVAVKDSGDETKRQILDAAVASYTNSVKTAETLLKNSTSSRNTSARTTAPAPVIAPYRK